MDAITIQRARRQDRTAQAALLRELQDGWFRLCRSLLGNQDEAGEQRAIRIQLVELYKQSGQHEKALEQLTELINAPAAGQ